MGALCSIFYAAVPIAARKQSVRMRSERCSGLNDTEAAECKRALDREQSLRRSAW
jgi:hypothetical protein